MDKIDKIDKKLNEQGEMLRDISQALAIISERIENYGFSGITFPQMKED